MTNIEVLKIIGLDFFNLSFEDIDQIKPRKARGMNFYRIEIEGRLFERFVIDAEDIISKFEEVKNKHIARIKDQFLFAKENPTEIACIQCLEKMRMRYEEMFKEIAPFKIEEK